MTPPAAPPWSTSPLCTTCWPRPGDARLPYGDWPFCADQHPEQLGLQPGDRIEVDAQADTLAPRSAVGVTLHRTSGRTENIQTVAAVETQLEVELLRAGGVIPFILSRALESR